MDEPRIEDGDRDEEVIELPADEPPKNGEWAPSPFRDITPEEVDEGNALGESIDTDDDDDNGGFR